MLCKPKNNANKALFMPYDSTHTNENPRNLTHQSISHTTIDKKPHEIYPKIDMNNQNIQIRPATRDDYTQVCTLISALDAHHVDLLPDKFRPSGAPDATFCSQDVYLAELNDEKIALFVAESEEKLLGFIKVYEKSTPENPILVPKRFLLLDNLYVSEQNRGQGIAQALYKKVNHWAKNREIDTIQLNVYAKNKKAVDFYDKLGFTPSSTTYEKNI